MYLNTVRMIFIQPGIGEADEHRYPVRSLHMRTIDIFIARNVAVGRFIALYDKLYEIYKTVGTLDIICAGEQLVIRFTQKDYEIGTIYKNDVLSNLEELDYIVKDVVE